MAVVVKADTCGDLFDSQRRILQKILCLLKPHSSYVVPGRTARLLAEQLMQMGDRQASTSRHFAVPKCPVYVLLDEKEHALDSFVNGTPWRFPYGAIRNGGQGVSAILQKDAHQRATPGVTFDG